MTKQEVKDEMRRMEGDPQIKQRRRQIAMQIATQRLKKDVPTADVVVTNPTEFAIALKYDTDDDARPARGRQGPGLHGRCASARSRSRTASRSSSASRWRGRCTSWSRSARRSRSSSTPPSRRSWRTCTS